MAVFIRGIKARLNQGIGRSVCGYKISQREAFLFHCPFKYYEPSDRDRDGRNPHRYPCREIERESNLKFPNLYCKDQQINPALVSNSI